MDLGCYTGWAGAYFKNYPTESYFVIGCDLDLGYLKIAKYSLDGVVRADMRRLPFRNQAFENGMCIGAIEHLSANEAADAFLEFKRVCGITFLSTPNGWRGGGNKLLVEEKPLQRHQTSFTKEDLKRFGAKRIRGLGWKREFKYSHFFLIIPYVFPRFAEQLIALL